MIIPRLPPINTIELKDFIEKKIELTMANPLNNAEVSLTLSSFDLR